VGGQRYDHKTGVYQIEYQASFARRSFVGSEPWAVWQSVEDVMARLHVTCPGPGNTRFI
jgi:hypothetical protein